MNLISKKHTSTIEFDPRVLYESLGSKIIETDSIAIAEQIKNANDASSKKDVIIDFSNYYQDLITITDFGHGMTIDEIKEKWFLVGTSNKQEDLMQLGGKGIGRFSLFRLADTITIDTFSNGKNFRFSLDKNKMQKNENISQITIVIEETDLSQNPGYGTKISLTNVNRKIDFLEIQKDLENMNTPFTKNNFEVIFPKNIPLTSYLKPEKAIKYSPFYANVKFKGNQILNYNYICSINDEIISKNDNSSKISKKISDNSIPNIDLGEIELNIYNFYFEKEVKKFLEIDENSLVLH